MSSKTLYIYSLDLTGNAGSAVTFPLTAAIVQTTEQTKITLDNKGTVVESFNRSAYKRLDDDVAIRLEDILDDSRFAGYGIYSTYTVLQGDGVTRFLYGTYKCPAYYLRWKFVQGTTTEYLHMIGTEELLTPWSVASQSENKDVLLLGIASPSNAQAGAYRLEFSGIRVTVESSTWPVHGNYWPATNLAGFSDQAYWPEGVY